MKKPNEKFEMRKKEKKKKAEKRKGKKKTRKGKKIAVDLTLYFSSFVDFQLFIYIPLNFSFFCSFIFLPNSIVSFPFRFFLFISFYLILLSCFLFVFSLDLSPQLFLFPFLPHHFIHLFKSFSSFTVLGGLRGRRRVGIFVRLVATSFRIHLYPISFISLHSPSSFFKFL